MDEFIFGQCRIDRVAPIVSHTVFDKCNQGFRFLTPGGRCVGVLPVQGLVVHNGLIATWRQCFANVDKVGKAP